MHSIVVATADEDLRVRLVEQLATEGRAVTCCATWADTLARMALDSTRLVLVDAELDGASGALLDAIRQSVPHRPALRVVRGDLPPLDPIRSPGQLLRAAAGAVRPALSAREARLLELCGLGPDAVLRLQSMVSSPLPVRIQGERGTGKQWVAQILHRMAGPDRPFVVVRPGEEALVRDGSAGTLFLEEVDGQGTEAILRTFALAEATGWRVMAGSRRPPEPTNDSVSWAHLHLRPMRERPKEIRPLARLYLDEYRRRLGLPARRVHAKLWERIERYEWPGNQRELETFVVQMATSTRGAMLSLDTVPRRVLSLLDPHERDRGERRAFEELVESRLRPVVARYEPGPDVPSLYRLVIDATERALLRVALGQTAGNQKAAAELLGVARNTLRERIARLDPLGEEQ